MFVTKRSRFQRCLGDNCYPQNFIDKYKKSKENKTGVTTVNKEKQNLQF